MVLFGGRAKWEAPLRPEQKWDAISLRDFKSKSWWNGMAYGYLYFMLILSVVVYGLDTFTAVNLLAFDQWSGSIEPADLIIPLEASKWIFSVCIILSFVNLAYEFIRAWRVMKRGSVAECFLDSLAVRLESIRWGNGQGWRRFLVFTALAKSKKGAEYVALFSYFSFQSWIRVLICSGPRQFVNATTLYAVYNSSLIPTDLSTVESTLEGFFAKIGTLYEEDTQQALILSSMLFTLVVWVFSALYLILAVLFWLFFLWHYLPRDDGGLHGYCERKVNKRLLRIVAKKVNKAIAKEEARQRKADFKAAMKAGETPPASRQATLPTLPGVAGGDDKLAEMPLMGRNETNTTLPAYTSRPSTPQNIELASFDQKRPVPSRQATTATTMSTVSSASSRVPPINRFNSPAPSVPSIDYNQFGAPPPLRPDNRPGSAASNRSFGPQNPQIARIATGGPGFMAGGGIPYTATPSPLHAENNPSIPPPVWSPIGGGESYGRPTPRPTPMPMDGRSSPAPSAYSNSNRSAYNGPAYNGPAYNGPAYMPTRANTNPMPPPSQHQYPPQRNMTAPMPRQHPGYGYDMDLESQNSSRW